VPGPGAGERVQPRLAPLPQDAAEEAGYRSVWDAQEIEFSPSLEFLFPHKALLTVEHSLAGAATAGLVP
jgi:hypothetical protein